MKHILRDTKPLDAHDPRAFVHGTGFIFQGVGMVFLLGGCTISSFSGLIQGQTDVSPANVVEWITMSPPGQVIAAINIIVTSMSGLALMVFGVGLQNARPHSANGAVATCAILTASWCATLIASISAAPHFLRIGLHVIFILVSLALFLLALAARRELKLHPPLINDEPITPEFLAQFDTQRRIERELNESADHS